MRAGEFLAQGADTCVYDPPLRCGEFRGDAFVSGPRVANSVSRIVAANSPEVQIQSKLRDTVPEKYKQFFTLYTSACTTFLVTKQDTQRRRPGKRTTSCSLYAHLQHVDFDAVVEPPAQLINLVTPKLSRTLNETLTSEPDKTRPAMLRLLRALLNMEGEYLVYFDGHEKNIGWNETETELTLFDFGWARTTPESFLAYCQTLESEERRNYYAEFVQFYYPMAMCIACAERGCEVLQLRRIWDVVSILGVLRLQKGPSGLYVRESQLFPDIELCIQLLIDAVTRPGSASLSDLHAIFDSTLAKHDVLIRTPRILEPPTMLSPISELSDDSAEGPCKIT